MTTGTDVTDATDARGPIRAVFFDIGGVLTSGPWESFSRYERESDLPDGLIRKINSTNPDANAWTRFERGEVDTDGFAELFRAEALTMGFEVDPHAILASLRGETCVEMIEAVRFCRGRYKTAALTNNFVRSAATEREGISTMFDGLFDAMIESSKVGARKPDPRFYEMACQAVSVEPTEAVFLDDLGINLKPARAMGMHTIKVVDPAVAVAELYGVLGEAPEGWTAPVPEPA
jgi:putative hydrolase of the HAD superfamily